MNVEHRRRMLNPHIKKTRLCFYDLSLSLHMHWDNKLTFHCLPDRCYQGLFATTCQKCKHVEAVNLNSWEIKCLCCRYRCNLVDLMVEMDRILRQEGTVVIRDSPEVIDKVGRIARAIRWTSTVHDKEPESHSREKILVATKSLWKLPSRSNWFFYLFSFLASILLLLLRFQDVSFIISMKWGPFIYFFFFFWLQHQSWL